VAGAPAALDRRTGVPQNAPGAGVAAAAVAPLRRPLRLGQTIAGVAAGLVGVLLLGGTLLLVIGSVPDPVALWLSTVAAAAPAVLYSLLVVSFDRLEREPWRLLLGAFGWGAVVAALFSALVGAITGGVLSAAYGDQAGTLLNVGLGAPFIEETFKGVALLGLLLMFRAELDDVLDGLIYGALIGLGFAMTENILYFGQAYLTSGVSGLTRLFLVRAVLGGLGHALYTGTTGAAVGWARGRHGRGLLRFVVPVLGWGLAVFQHFLWNTGPFFIAMRRGPDSSLLSLVLMEAALFTLPPLLILAAVALGAGRRESAILRDQLAEEAQAGVLTPEEYDTLTSGRLRWRASLAAYRRGGVARWALQQRFFQAAAELAFHKYHRSQGDADPEYAGPRPLSEQVYRAQLAALRQQLGESKV
jgi:RsiW-degrading membrane proteinase PrsW (M82 family)